MSVIWYDGPLSQNQSLCDNFVAGNGNQKALNKKSTIKSSLQSCCDNQILTQVLQDTVKKCRNSVASPAFSWNFACPSTSGQSAYPSHQSRLCVPRVLDHIKSLSKRNVQVSVVMNDEYLTPQVCAQCHKRTLMNLRERSTSSIAAGRKIHAELKCTSCNTVWNPHGFLSSHRSGQQR